MAVKFWVPASTATVRGAGIGVSPLNKQVAPPGVVDETDRVAIELPANLWRLRAYPGTVAVSHGGITSVKLHARIYMSNNGPFSWDFTDYSAYVAPYILSGTSKLYSLPATITEGATTYNVGHRLDDGGHNFNLGGQPTALKITVDATSLVAWDNAKLTACEFGLAIDEVDLASSGYLNSKAGWMPIEGAAGSTPRWNISQLILEVDAADAPPSYATSFMAVFA